MSLDVSHDDIPNAENYLRTQIADSVWLTESGVSILTSLRSSGFAIADRSFYAIRRDVLLGISREPQIQAIDKDQYVPARYETNVPTWNIGRSYMYSFRYEVRDAETGETTEGFYSYKSDNRLSIGELETIVKDDLLFGPVSQQAENLEITSVALARVYRTRR